MEEVKNESTWLTRLRDEQIQNYDRLEKLRKFLQEVGVESKMSKNMLVLLTKQLEIMEAYDTVLCKRLALADVEEYCLKIGSQNSKTTDTANS